ncbi:unnamed protein product [Darwinula stevensoni]|uniref:Uncharacterized protein n=1 Tax=Darwinula stevensoni TaxID=69355 RepID=A0A7R8X810_9CRUS|nr:unnamed protein product [Darwinula stevensoni]CAG0883905.1 unnamed protein product [Darwinula stevensoni]
MGASKFAIRKTDFLLRHHEPSEFIRAQAGRSNGEILKALKNLNIKKVFIWRVVKRFKETDTVASRPRIGRLRSQRTPTVIRAVKVKIRRNPQRCMRQMAKEGNMSENLPLPTEVASMLKKVVFMNEKNFTIQSIHNCHNDKVLAKDISKVPDEAELSEGHGFLDEMNWALKTSWILGNISHNAAFIVTIAYWSLLFAPGEVVSLSNGVAHISNALQVMMNLCIDLRPFRIHHFYIPFVYSSVYIIFTGIYFAAGGTYNADGAKSLRRPVSPLAFVSYFQEVVDLVPGRGTPASSSKNVIREYD